MKQPLSGKQRKEAAGFLLALLGVGLVALLVLLPTDEQGAQVPAPPAAAPALAPLHTPEWIIARRRWDMPGNVVTLSMDVVALAPVRMRAQGLQMTRDICNWFLQTHEDEVRTGAQGRVSWFLRPSLFALDGVLADTYRIEVRRGKCGDPELVWARWGAGDNFGIFKTTWQRDGKGWRLEVDLVPGEIASAQQMPEAGKSLKLCRAMLDRLPSPFAPLVNRTQVDAVVVRHILEDGSFGPERRLATSGGQCPGD